MVDFAGEVLCQLETCGSTELHQAVEAAKAAFGHWSKMSGMERARIMIQAAHIIEVVKNSCFDFKNGCSELTDYHKSRVLVGFGYCLVKLNAFT